MADLHDNSQIHDRKLEHIRIVQSEKVEPVENPFRKYRLPYSALPEMDLKRINTNCDFLGFKLAFPFLIASMTGGPAKAALINKNLALACEAEKVGLGLGSMRVIMKDEKSIPGFQVKKFAPSVPVMANLGLVQVNYGFGADEINRLIDISGADAIFLHINHLQEAVQPEGDTNFSGLLAKLELILPKLKKPVIIKEVGAGIDSQTAKKLSDIGIKWFDVAGLGGTSWTVVEAYRRNDDLGFLFAEEGIPTDIAIKGCREMLPEAGIIAEGGIRSGLDIAKSIALGADLAAAAKPLLNAALESPEACITVIKKLKRELQVAMFVAGCRNINQLKNIKLELK